MPTGLILHLQRLSTEDGPGLRTTVFCKGCSLHCAWCHNPESLSHRPQVQWQRRDCLRCATCVALCPLGALTLSDQGISIDRKRCNGCGVCAEECPANAMELLGSQVSVDQVFAEVVKDRTYYEKSGGGVTVSGGEPTLQADFVVELLKRLKATGIATALDTCGHCSPSNLEKVLPYTDLVLFDVKEIDPQRHRHFTGHDNSRILENLLFVQRYIQASPSQIALWVRTPLIPGATATSENLSGIGAFLARQLNGAVQRWELCAFNNLCRDKYQRLGITWPFASTPLMSQEWVSALEACAKQSGVNPEIVVATGATRIDR